MDDSKKAIASLLNRAEDYGATTIELFKLRAINKSADILSSIVTRLATMLTVALSLLLLNIGLAFWIGSFLENIYYGFFIVGGFYALFAIPLYLFRRSWLKDPVSNSIIKELLKHK